MPQRPGPVGSVVVFVAAAAGTCDVCVCVCVYVRRKGAQEVKGLPLWRHVECRAEERACDGLRKQCCIAAHSPKGKPAHGPNRITPLCAEVKASLRLRACRGRFGRTRALHEAQRRACVRVRVCVCVRASGVRVRSLQRCGSESVTGQSRISS